MSEDKPYLGYATLLLLEAQEGIEQHIEKLERDLGYARICLHDVKLAISEISTPFPKAEKPKRSRRKKS